MCYSIPTQTYAKYLYVVMMNLVHKIMSGGEVQLSVVVE